MVVIILKIFKENIKKIAQTVSGVIWWRIYVEVLYFVI